MTALCCTSSVTTLLEKLRPSYRSVVLALQNGPLLKATKEIDVPLVAAHKKTVLAVDWTEVTRMVNAHERSEMRLGGGGGEGQPGGDSQALSVRQYGGRSSSSGGGGGGWQQQQGKKKKTEGSQKKLPAYNEKGEPRCFNCDVYGHMGRDCSQKKTKAAPKSSAQRRAGQDREEAVEEAQAALSESEGGDEREWKGEELSLCATIVPSSPTQAEAAMQTSGPSSSTLSSSASLKTKTYKNAAEAGVGKPACALAPAAKKKPAAGADQPAASSSAIDKARQKKGLGSLSMDEALATSVWGIDTMASTHVSGNRKAFGTVRRHPETNVKVANGEIVKVNAIGDVPLKMQRDDGRFIQMRIDDVLFDEEFSNNLLSWGCLKRDGWSLGSNKEEGDYVITPKGSKIPLIMTNRVLILKTGQTERVFTTQATSSGATSAVLRAHELLGHMSVTKMTSLYTGKQASVSGLPKVTAQQITTASEAVRACAACHQGKMTRTPLSTGPTKPGHRGLDRGSAPARCYVTGAYEAALSRGVTLGR